MSYVIATSISVSRDGKEIYVTGDDNNVFPKDYRKMKFSGSLNDFIYDLWGGNVQPTMSANNGKAYYVARRMSEEIRIGWGDDSEKVKRIIVEKRLDKLFLKLWFDRSKAGRKYKLMYQTGIGREDCVTSITKYGFRYSSFGPCKVVNWYKAMNIVNSHKNITMKEI